MKKILSLIAVSCLAIGIHASDKAVQSESIPKGNFHNSQKQADNNKPYYYGTVEEVLHGGAYTYINVKEKTEKTFWIVVENSDVKVGDFIRFKQQLVAQNFNSKDLNRKFDEIMFADNLEYKTDK